MARLVGMRPEPDSMDVLEQLFPPRRFVALSEAEAAELGTGALGEWRGSSPNGVHVDAVDYLELLRDGLRWRSAIGAARAVGLVLVTAAVMLAVIAVLGVVIGALR
jgi:hypothetical protein